jgi:hypothetical protein
MAKSKSTYHPKNEKMQIKTTHRTKRKNLMASLNQNGRSESPNLNYEWGLKTAPKIETLAALRRRNEQPGNTKTATQRKSRSKPALTEIKHDVLALHRPTLLLPPPLRLRFRTVDLPRLLLRSSFPLSLASFARSPSHQNRRQGRGRKKCRDREVRGFALRLLHPQLTRVGTHHSRLSLFA